jgi:nitronate monooxygenase
MPANGHEGKSWNETRVASLLGIDYPIVQAPFGGFPSQRLTATVSNLGGLGSLGAVTLSGPAIKDAVAEIRTLTDKPFAVNLWVSASDLEASQISPGAIEKKVRQLAHLYDELGIRPPTKVEVRPQNFEQQVHAAFDAGAPVLSFIYGVPAPEILNDCHRRGIWTIGTATTPEEARLLEEAGIDLIVASGFEGGGHRGSFLRSPEDSLVGSISLIPLVADAVDIPVIAAGGIADGRGLVAALALGAEGVQIGTAFLTCIGSGVSQAYRAALLSKVMQQTDLTSSFTGRLARGIKNRLMDELDALGDALPFPLQHALVQTLVMPASHLEREDLMPLWGGQSIGLSRYTQASELMAELVATANASSRS